MAAASEAYLPRVKESLALSKSSLAVSSRPFNGNKSSMTLSSSDLKRDAYLRKKYGLSLAQFEKMLELQKGLCGICQRFLPGQRRMFPDHDHKTGQVRGILCWTCNFRVLGRGLEKPELHEAAARYLRSTFDGRTV